jgi:predicted DsbA family dithiol-disulfide isomerase
MEFVMTTLKIDFVSDVVCPWCVIGLKSLEAALERTAGDVDAELHVQPFELNPDMPPGGQAIAERLSHYSPEQRAQLQANVRARAAEVGFEMGPRDDARIYNTFDAHRLLHWAEGQDRQTALKHALFTAYFTRGESLEDADVLVRAAEAAGLDGGKAREVLASGQFAGQVRLAEQRWRELGVNSVPAIVINDKYLISGGQPVEVFEQALRKIAAEG